MCEVGENPNPKRCELISTGSAWAPCVFLFSDSRFCVVSKSMACFMRVSPKWWNPNCAVASLWLFFDRSKMALASPWQTRATEKDGRPILFWFPLQGRTPSQRAVSLRSFKANPPNKAPSNMELKVFIEGRCLSEVSREVCPERAPSE